MKLPRNLSGLELAARLNRFGYRIVRQTGSHIRLVSDYAGTAHKVTVPHHRSLDVGTLSGIVSDVANYLGIERKELLKRLFE